MESCACDIRLMFTTLIRTCPCAHSCRSPFFRLPADERMLPQAVFPLHHDIQQRLPGSFP